MEAAASETFGGEVERPKLTRFINYSKLEVETF